MSTSVLASSVAPSQSRPTWIVIGAGASSAVHSRSMATSETDPSSTSTVFSAPSCRNRMVPESPLQVGESASPSTSRRGSPVGLPVSSTSTTWSPPSITKAIADPSGDQTGPLSERVVSETFSRGG